MSITYSNTYRLDMNGSVWTPFAFDIALDILKKRGHVEISNLPDGLVRHFILESALRGWSEHRIQADDEAIKNYVNVD